MRRWCVRAGNRGEEMDVKCEVRWRCCEEWALCRADGLAPVEVSDSSGFRLVELLWVWQCSAGEQNGMCGLVPVGCAAAASCGLPSGCRVVGREPHSARPPGLVWPSVGQLTGRV